MTKAFENKVIKMGMVDTKNYRYRYVVTDTCRIERILLSKLDTTAAYTDWEVVKKL